MEIIDRNRAVTVFRPILLVVACTATLMTLSSCDDDATSPSDIVFPASGVSYAQHVQPYFNLSCATSSCHDDQTRAGNLSLTSYLNLISRPGIVIAGDWQSSLLVQRIDGRLPHPIGVPIIINENQLNGIKKWIEEGAKNN